MIIAPQECLSLLKSGSEAAFLDVRSEGEFADAAIPGFLNAPILNNEERHLIGIEFKNAGREAAIKLALSLTQTNRAEKIERWKDLSKNKAKVFVACWRGGLRSRYAQAALRAEGVEALRVKGGYKALRKELLNRTENFSNIFVLSGRTGSGKSQLIQQFSNRFVDLENIAKHRGSIFGAFENTQQPRQATFENELGLRLWSETGPMGVEDESVRIGNITVPKALKDRMKMAPVVLIEEALEDRARRIFKEYVMQALPEMRENYQTYLLKIEKHLGGAFRQELSNELKELFSGEIRFEKFSPWIQKILESYYDKKYDFAFERQNRKILFRGNFKEVLEFFQLNPTLVF